MRKINSNDGNKTIDERHTWTVNNYCMSIEFFHPRNWKHSSSRKWIRVQFCVSVDLTAQFLWSWTRRGRRIDGRARDVLQLISTISMCTCTSEKERISCVAPSRFDEIKCARLRYFGRRKITGYEMASALIILCGGYSLNQRGKSTENDVRFDYVCVTPVGHFINRMSRHCRIR